MKSLPQEFYMSMVTFWTKKKIEFLETSFLDFEQKFPPGLSKFHSTCPEDHFKPFSWKARNWGNSLEKEIYIPIKWFSFRNILQRKIIICIPRRWNFVTDNQFFFYRATLTRWQNLPLRIIWAARFLHRSTARWGVRKYWVNTVLRMEWKKKQKDHQ